MDGNQAADILSELIDDEDLTVDLIMVSDTWCTENEQIPLSPQQARRAVDHVLIYVCDALRSAQPPAPPAGG